LLQQDEVEVISKNFLYDLNIFVISEFVFCMFCNEFLAP